MRSATFINKISSDANSSNTHIEASVSSSSFSACPSTPLSQQDCIDFGNCYYLSPAEAAYKNNIELKVCEDGNSSNTKYPVILDFTNVVDDTNYAAGTATCYIDTYHSHSMECSFTTKNTDYKFHQIKGNKNKTYKITTK
ncbi:hypothetical protein [Fangia hongkongensis]|uniref:hypothetical protein n=1 Tax=Fangia hongkongensis TaxID=270495 RepID=UPI001907C03D|nr:hypothetical protein [Fangia hongkongensis]